MYKIKTKFDVRKAFDNILFLLSACMLVLAGYHGSILNDYPQATYELVLGVSLFNSLRRRMVL